MPRSCKKLVARLREIKSVGPDRDHEIAHALADKALLDYIDSEEIRELHNELARWFP